MDIDKKRDRLRYRSWHRGTKEMDILLGRFADAHVSHFSEEELAAYEAVLAINDPDMYDWITAQKPVPADYQSTMIERLIAFLSA